MKALSITGGRPLTGELEIHGAKNSVLPILAACVLCPGTCTIHNCPEISDVDTAVEILEHLGCKVLRKKGSIRVDATSLVRYDISTALMSKMRSSILFIGALLARVKTASFSMPGGCRLGRRPIDFHLQAFSSLGAIVENSGDTIICSAPFLEGANINLPSPSVGATENAILAAMGANGLSRIRNAAREPEIADLCQFLCKLGARIAGIGTSELLIEAAEPLRPGEYWVMPDRIETATYLAAVAGCGGQVLLKKAKSCYLKPVVQVLKNSGCEIEEKEQGIRIYAPERLNSPGIIHTAPYPGFPTDAQAPVMAALLRARGQTLVVDQIFENRFQHVTELKKLGANIFQEGCHAIVRGVEQLSGAPLQAKELRGGAALVIGALGANGYSIITGVEYMERGYDSLVKNLSACGAEIKQVEYFPKMVYNTL